MKLQPVYWIHRGPNIPVRRGRWFFAEDRPCAEALSDELEEGYLWVFRRSASRWTNADKDNAPRTAPSSRGRNRMATSFKLR